MSGDFESGLNLSEAAIEMLSMPAGPFLTSETVQAYRDACAEGFLPRAARAKSNYGVTTAWIEISGIRCLSVRPLERVSEAVILHGFGGGFVAGSPEQEVIVAAPVAAMTGAEVVIPDYRLAPEHPWPAAVNDCFMVYAELANSVPSGKFALAGESAGGNVALVMLDRALREGVPMPAAVGLMSPWCDLADGGDSLRANDGRDPTLDRAGIEAARDLYAGGHDFAHREISPMLADWDARVPPVIITSGTRDLLMSQSVTLSRLLRRAGIAVDLRLWDHLWHVFEFYDELPEAEDSLRQISAFLQKQLR